jgi:hypothetical protein
MNKNPSVSPSDITSIRAAGIYGHSMNEAIKLMYRGFTINQAITIVKRSMRLSVEKGVKGGPCNVTHCQKPESAHHYNKIMKAYYCRECAERIEAAAKVGGISFYDDL